MYTCIHYCYCLLLLLLLLLLFLLLFVIQVDVKCEWQGQSVEETTSIDDGVDSVLGVRKPTFKRPFVATTLGSSNVYQTIPMMMV